MNITGLTTCKLQVNRTILTGGGIYVYTPVSVIVSLKKEPISTGETIPHSDTPQSLDSPIWMKYKVLDSFKAQTDRVKWSYRQGRLLPFPMTRLSGYSMKAR